MNESAAIYKMLAVGFHYPDAELLNALRGLPFFQELLEGISLEALQRDFNRIFSLSVAGGVPPYETEYGRRDVFTKSQQMADIGGFYGAFGLEVAQDAHTRVDHICAELELMHWLTLKEEHAKEKGLEKEATLCRDAAKKFLQDHLGTWTPFFGLEVAKAAHCEIYQTLGRQLGEFINSECERLNAHPERIFQWEPRLPEEDLGCGSCVEVTDQNHI